MLTFLVSIVPSVGALFLFWLALRAIFQADRRERAAVARFEAAQDAEHARLGARDAAAGDRGPLERPDGGSGAGAAPAGG